MLIHSNENDAAPALATLIIVVKKATDRGLGVQLIQKPGGILRHITINNENLHCLS
jgi:hypothetical protein